MPFIINNFGNTGSNWVCRWKPPCPYIDAKRSIRMRSELLADASKTLHHRGHGGSLDLAFWLCAPGELGGKTLVWVKAE
jgi:hypothetical protein